MIQKKSKFRYKAIFALVNTLVSFALLFGFAGETACANIDVPSVLQNQVTIGEKYELSLKRSAGQNTNDNFRKIADEFSLSDHIFSGGPENHNLQIELSEETQECAIMSADTYLLSCQDNHFRLSGNSCLLRYAVAIDNGIPYKTVIIPSSLTASFFDSFQFYYPDRGGFGEDLLINLIIDDSLSDEEATFSVSKWGDRFSFPNYSNEQMEKYDKPNLKKVFPLSFSSSGHESKNDTVIAISPSNFEKLFKVFDAFPYYQVKVTSSNIASVKKAIISAEYKLEHVKDDGTIESSFSIGNSLFAFWHGIYAFLFGFGLLFWNIGLFFAFYYEKRETITRAYMRKGNSKYLFRKAFSLCYGPILSLFFIVFVFLVPLGEAYCRVFYSTIGLIAIPDIQKAYSSLLLLFILFIISSGLLLIHFSKKRTNVENVRRISS